jgi:polyhydroxyalkanoate synthase subunit PhaC
MRTAAAVLWVVVAAATTWFALPRDTDRRRVQAKGLPRLLRAERTAALRVLLWLAGWPHLFDVLFFGAARDRRRADATPSDVVWQHGKAQLHRYQGGPRTHREPVLLVHSTVSEPWILDLTPTRSLVRHLVDAGFDVYLLDWGAPGRKESGHGIAHYLDVLRVAEAAVLAESATDHLHRMGYCFGASVCLFDAAAAYVRSTVLIAPVVDFTAPGGFQRVIGSSWLPPALALDSAGCVPAAVIRESFHGLRPQALKTMWARFRYRRLADAEYKRFYAAMARWAWKQRRLPGALFFDVVDLYRANPLPRRLAAAPPPGPVLLVMAERDHIVPKAASKALADLKTLRTQIVHTSSGHVSMIVGSSARTTVWPGIAEWLAARQGGVRARSWRRTG